MFRQIACINVEAEIDMFKSIRNSYSTPIVFKNPSPSAFQSVAVIFMASEKLLHFDCQCDCVGGLTLIENCVLLSVTQPHFANQRT
uniref:Uncharacterized protein n=1 Tax=Glossina palpalis gambiensis TaxID=67801 RepID=A0A1B0BK45_9MUSC